MKSIVVQFLAVMTAALSLLSPLSSFADDDGIVESTEAAVGDSIILEQDFESQNIGKWTPFGGGNLSLSEETSHSGGQSLKITGRKNPYDGPSFYCDTLVNPGDAYSFDGWVYHESSQTEPFSWTIRTRDVYGSDAFTQIASVDVEPGVWTNISGIVTVAEDAVSSLMYFECGNAALDFSVDDVVVIGNTAENTDNVVSDFQDKYYMDFEQSFEQWVARGDLTVAHTDEYSYTGNYSIYATNRKEPWNAPTVPISDKIIKGESYYYSAYVMYNGKEYSDSHGFRMEIQYTLGGSDQYNLISAKTLNKGKWTKIDGYFTVPVEAENVYFYIQTDNLEEGEQLTNDDLMSYYVDNAVICKAEIKEKEEITRNIINAAIAVIVLITLFFIGGFIHKRFKKKSEALELVSLDAMTGVFNRNAYEKKIEELEAEGEKFKSLYFVLCDVNFLKYINDNHGHETGDAAIIRCAEILKRVIGKNGNVYRIGGDEFVCIAEKELKDSLLAETEKESAVDKGYPFEIACGFAQYDSEKYPTVKDIVTQCDKEMYVHKQEIKARNKEFSRK
ncbi:MAG: carbohydrate binding domain-containing protein [Ruminococcus sp.]|nr:carbohydrate binding domain-containing protein [Ruminococcus sp.]